MSYKNSATENKHQVHCIHGSCSRMFLCSEYLTVNLTKYLLAKFLPQLRDYCLSVCLSRHCYCSHYHGISVHPDPWISEEELISISSCQVSSEDASAKLQGTAHENSMIPDCDELPEEQRQQDSVGALASIQQCLAICLWPGGRAFVCWLINRRFSRLCAETSKATATASSVLAKMPRNTMWRRVDSG